MSNDFVFRGSDTTNRTVTFSDATRPHNDALTLLLVSINADGLTAEQSIELIGDSGAIENLPIGHCPPNTEDIGLGALFVGLSAGELWSGSIEWRSLAGELLVALTTNDVGHVEVEFKIQPTPWQSTWSASCTVVDNLGDLARVGNDLGSWFESVDAE